MQATGPSFTLGRYTVPLAPRAARSALVTEVTGMSRPLRLWLGALLGVMGAAAIAALIAIPPGWEVFGTTPSFEWGMMIVGYVFFALMTSGLCLASSLGTVFGIERFRPLEKRHAILAVLSLTTAFGIIALDLHYPVRMVFGALLVPSPSSPMWWMGVFYGAYLVVLLVEVWSMFTPHPKIHQWSCTLAAAIAICAPTTLGAVFGVLSAKSFWAGPLTPVQMVTTAFLAGTSLLGIVFYAVSRFRLQDRERAVRLGIPSIRLLIAVGLLIVGSLLALKIGMGLTGSAPGLRDATVALVSGPIAAPFWLVRVLIGLVIPLLIVTMPMTRTPVWLLVAAVAALTGVFVDRYLFVMAGQIAPISAGAGMVSSPYASYTPTIVEMTIMLGAGAFLAFVYTLAERYLDLEESDDHVFFPFPWVTSHAHDVEGAAQAPAEPVEVAGSVEVGPVRAAPVVLAVPVSVPGVAVVEGDAS
ncbi:MAG: NrfD/PsrC family molybdoenzyme membrane anchor subunit [Candidatus Limnocylindrales bacterium]